jgi:hypothetical protein
MPSLLDRFEAASQGSLIILPAAADLVGFGTMSFERYATRIPGTDRKKFFNHNTAAAMLAQKGLVLPSMSETFEYVIIPYLEGTRYTPEQKAVLRGMLEGGGEHTRNLQYCAGDTLYLGEGVAISDRTARGTDRRLRYIDAIVTSCTKHDISGLKRNAPVPLRDAPRSLVKALYSRPANALPRRVTNGTIFILENDILRPLGRDMENCCAIVDKIWSVRGARKNS